MQLTSVGKLVIFGTYYQENILSKCNYGKGRGNRWTVLNYLCFFVVEMKQTHSFFQKMLQPRAYIPSSVADLLVQHRPRVVRVLHSPSLPRPAGARTRSAAGQHQRALMELLLHDNQTPLICLSSSSRDQKSPSPMETGAGSNETSHGISEAIRGNLTAFMI